MWYRLDTAGGSSHVGVRMCGWTRGRRGGWEQGVRTLLYTDGGNRVLGDCCIQTAGTGCQETAVYRRWVGPRCQETAVYIWWVGPRSQETAVYRRWEQGVRRLLPTEGETGWQDTAVHGECM